MKLDRTVLQAKRLGVFSCKKDQTLAEAIRLMVEEDISTIVVVDDQGFLTGVITRTDILRAYNQLDEWEMAPISQFMNHDVITTTLDADLSDVASLLIGNQIHRVVVAREENGKKVPLSVVSAADLIYHMAKGVKKTQV